MIYLLQQQNNLKIGYTNNLLKRIKQYNTHNSDFKILYVLNGNREKEKELHKQFEKFRKSTEWFEYTEEIIDYFNKNGTIIEAKDEFVIMSVFAIDEINEKLKGNEIKVLLACVRCSKISSYEESGNSFLTCSREFKNLVTGIKPQNVCKYLAKLNELGFIKRISRSEYELNPLYFFRGTLTQRTKCLMKIETNE